MNINGYSIKDLFPLPIPKCFNGSIYHGDTKIAIIFFGNDVITITFIKKLDMEKYFQYFTRDKVIDLVHLSMIYMQYHLFTSNKIIAGLCNGDILSSVPCPQTADEIEIIKFMQKGLSEMKPPLTIRETRTFRSESDFNLTEKLWSRNDEQSKNAIGLLLRGNTLSFFPTNRNIK